MPICRNCRKRVKYVDDEYGICEDCIELLCESESGSECNESEESEESVDSEESEGSEEY